MATRDDYYSMFSLPADARAFEQTCLAQADLPPEARAVLDGDEPTPRYWKWLVQQKDNAGFYHSAQYYIRLKTPGQPATYPAGWSAADGAEAEAMLARAEKLWPGMVSLCNRGF